MRQSTSAPTVTAALPRVAARPEGKDGKKISLSALSRRRSSLAVAAPTPTGRPRAPGSSLNRLPRIAAPSPVKMNDEAKVDRVLGCTSLSQSSLAVDQKSGAFAYLAGATIVVNRGRRHKEGHLVGPSKSTFSALSFSPCGAFVATGEFGHAPCVRLYELLDGSSGGTGKFSGSQTREMAGHSNGIVAVKFSPLGDRLISVGEHLVDMSIVLWNWRTGEQIATARNTALVEATAISADGLQLVTVGQRCVKYWNIGENRKGIVGRSAILGDNFRAANYVDVAFLDENRVIAVTEKGTVVELIDRKVARHVQLGQAAFCMTRLGAEFYVGCSNGVVVSVKFSETEITTKTALCPPHFLSQDVAAVTSVEAFNEKKPVGAKFADIHSLGCVSSTGTVTIVYSDHSIYSWQSEGQGISKAHSALAHAGPIHALEMYPSEGDCLPSGSFLTGGADGTLRVWNLNHGKGATPMKNLLSNDLKKMVVLDASASLVAPKNKSSMPLVDRFEGGVKSVRVSRDGRHCAVGMRNGELMVLDLSSPSMEMIWREDAHEGDVMCIEYSTPSNDTPSLLACGGRDRQVHVFLPLSNYAHATTLADHSSAVIAIKFASSTYGFTMYTCASDKMIILWRLVQAESSLHFERANQISFLGAAFTDLHLSMDGRFLLTACFDRMLRTYHLSGKHVSAVKATTDSGVSGQTNCSRMAVDHSGTFVASICTDRFVYIVEAKSGNPVAVLKGFGDVLTGIAFSADQKRLVLTSSNGCIYVFRLSDRIVNRIAAAKNAARTPSPDSVLGSGSEAVSEEAPRDSEADSSHFGSVNSLAVDDDMESGVGSNSSVVLSGRNEEMSYSIRESSIDADSLNETFTVDGEERTAEQNNRAAPRYQSSKSMSSVRASMAGPLPSSSALSSPFMEENGRAGSPRRQRRKWGENAGGAVERDAATIHFHQDRSPSSSSPFSFSLDEGAMRLAPSTLPSNFQPQSRLGTVLREMETPHASTSFSSIYTRPSPSLLPSITSISTSSSSSAPPPSSSTSRLRENLLARKQAEQINNGGLSSSSLQSPPPALSPPSAPSFSRESPERVSLSKRFQLKSAVKEPSRTAWSPSASSTSSSATGYSSSSRRTASSIGLSPAAPAAATPSGAAAAAITRRQEDDSFSALRQHIRSRSQSPNQLIMNGLLAASTPNGINRGYERKDSEQSSYPLSSRRTPSRSNLRGGEELRKSSQALDKIALTRKLRQSTENLAEVDGSSPLSRARSIGNLRGGGERQLEMSMHGGGAFEIDEARPRLSSPLSRISRNLARSMGQLNGGEGNAMEGSGPSPSYNRLAAPSSGGLLGAMSQLKKASNPDLAEERQYEEREDFTSPILKPRRGAVQKKVDRYHPRNRGLGGSRMESGSGESDSNASDASPLHSTYQRKESATMRSESLLSSPFSHSSASPRVMGGRRLGESPRLSSAPSTAAAAITRRVPNYLSHKMQLQPHDLEGPDLGSDESPRSSILHGNGNDWISNFEGKPDEIKNLASHVLQCTEEMAMAMNKMMHAKKLIREMEGMDEDDRATLLDVASNAMDVAHSTKLRGGEKKERRERENGGERSQPLAHTRLSSASSQSSSFSSSHNHDNFPLLRQNGPDLVALLRNNMAKQN